MKKFLFITGALLLLMTGLNSCAPSYYDGPGYYHVYHPNYYGNHVHHRAHIYNRSYQPK